ncbi:hypothetical protein F4604DRAFT_1581287, partial [Suillus subluteus]
STDPNLGLAPVEEPTPQSTDGSGGMIYTKAPAYVDNYDMTRKKNEMIEEGNKKWAAQNVILIRMENADSSRWPI